VSKIKTGQHGIYLMKVLLFLLVCSSAQLVVILHSNIGVNPNRRVGFALLLINFSYREKPPIKLKPADIKWKLMKYLRKMNTIGKFNG